MDHTYLTWGRQASVTRGAGRDGRFTGLARPFARCIVRPSRTFTVMIDVLRQRERRRDAG